jgi:hypothetical protein
MSAIPSVLVPMIIEDAMVTSSTLSEPNTGETSWVSAGTYAVGDRRIRTTTHREYECISAHTGITTYPEDDPMRWVDIGPTDKWAMFDTTVSTITETVTTMTVVVEPGFFNALALYGLVGANLSITIKTATGGTTIYSYSGALDGPYVDEWDWCWGPFRENTKFLVSNIEPYPEAEITITVTAGSGSRVGIGMLIVGDLRNLILSGVGGTQYGARAEPVDYSYIKINDYGDAQIVKRRSATDMKIKVFVPQEDADYALTCIQEVLALPAAWIATTVDGYEGLNVFGLGSGSMAYEGPNYTMFEINVKGLV